MMASLAETKFRDSVGWRRHSTGAQRMVVSVLQMSGASAGRLQGWTLASSVSVTRPVVSVICWMASPVPFLMHQPLWSV